MRDKTPSREQVLEALAKLQATAEHFDALAYRREVEARRAKLSAQKRIEEGRQLAYAHMARKIRLLAMELTGEDSLPRVKRIQSEAREEQG